MTSTAHAATDPKEGTMTTSTFDLDAHLAECAERMQAFVAQVLTPGTRCGDEFTNTDGMVLVVNHLSYGHADVDEVLARTATPVEAVLTGDGHYAERNAWHEGPADDAEWVRYERYSARGMESHGFVHGVTRRLLQTG